MDYAPLLVIAGRLLLGSLFLRAGIRHFFILGAVTPALAARGVPTPRAALIAASIFEVVASALLMLGLYVAAAAIGLVIFTIAASFLLLNFWDMQGPAREIAKDGWRSNIAIIGGLLIAAAQAL